MRMFRPINKDWMNETYRLSQAYTQGVEEFIEYAVQNDVLKLSTILCPCVKCKNKKRYPAAHIRKHLIWFGIMKNYTQWCLHGENPYLISTDQHPPSDQVEVEENIKDVDNKDKVKETNDKRKCREGLIPIHENDPISKVLSSDKRGRVCAKDESRKEEKDRVGVLDDELKTYIKEKIQSAMYVLIDKFKSVTREGSPRKVMKPTRKFTSSSVTRPRNLSNIFDKVFNESHVTRPTYSDKPPVILIDSQNKELAKGYIVTDSTAGICHGRKVGLAEKKVYINEVIEPDAPLWYPHDGIHTFSAYASGGYVIWYELWLKYI